MADDYVAYSGDNVTDPLIIDDLATKKAWRGRSWNYHEATLETSGRYADEPHKANDHFGFRIAQ